MSGHNKSYRGVILLLLLCPVIALSLNISNAYFSSTKTKESNITIGDSNVMIVESFIPPAKWQPNTSYDKDVKIKNKGSVDCYIRVYAAVSDTDIPVTMNIDTGSWMKKDGYYYYKYIVPTDTTTKALFTQVSIGDAKVDEDFEIIIYAESVQADGYPNAAAAFADIQ